ncbi:MAG TPA: hybrid sensor histidine kinase/response regulator [Candidatus Polarisedimenticolia bacterium]|nr:hybrid sensor histidine kinase/response regulator [Candidatus Polarisedimenticolia bacterium]
MAEAASGSAVRILLVEGSRSLRLVLSRALTEGTSPVEILMAGSLAEASSAIHSCPVDLIVAGGGLPDGSFLDLLRSGGSPSLPPFLVVDGSASGPRATEALGAGAADYIPLDDAGLARLAWRARREIETTRRAAGARPRDLEAAARISPCTEPASETPLLKAICHDLRTPLTGVVALLEMLEAGFDGPLNTAQLSRLERIHRAVDRLVSISDQIGDLVQAEAGWLQLASAPLDLCELAQAAGREVEESNGMQGAVLQVRVPADLPRAMGDAARVRQILSLVLTDALRNSGGMSFELHGEPRGSMVELILREAPRGIPVEALHGMDEAVRAEPNGSAASGIGLSIARSLARLHSGRLQLGAEAGDGVLASLALPAAPSDHRPRPDRLRELRSHS